jgi:hypothetical protein
MSCLSADELRAKAKVLSGLSGLKGHEELNETEREFIRLFADGGAAAALDHVLNHESLWHDPEQYAGEAFLRQFIEAARDYIIRTAKP